jgi:phosphatidylethanolamine-binding protein (PEBP) family uncharacterized protein
MNLKLSLAATATLALACTLAACSSANGPYASPSPSPSPAGPFEISSADIGPDGIIVSSVQGQGGPMCDGAGESIAVEWTTPPSGTRSMAVTFESMSVPAVYWSRADIDPAERAIEHGHYGASSGRELTNFFGVVYPMPPCPDNVVGEEFRLTVWALDTVLGDDVRTYLDLLEATEGHTLAVAHLDGTLVGNGGS